MGQVPFRVRRAEWHTVWLRVNLRGNKHASLVAEVHKGKDSDCDSRQRSKDASSYSSDWEAMNVILSEVFNIA